MDILLLGVVAILLITLYQLIQERKLKDAVTAINAVIPMTDREMQLKIQVNRLIAENVALENRLHQSVSDYGY